FRGSPGAGAGGAAGFDRRRLRRADSSKAAPGGARSPPPPGQPRVWRAGGGGPHSRRPWARLPPAAQNGPQARKALAVSSLTCKKFSPEATPTARFLALGRRASESPLGAFDGFALGQRRGLLLARQELEAHPVVPVASGQLSRVERGQFTSQLVGRD